MYTIEGYQPENNSWVKGCNVTFDGKEFHSGEDEWEDLDTAMKVSWRFRVLMDIPVRLLKNGVVVCSDMELPLVKPKSETELINIKLKEILHPEELEKDTKNVTTALIMISVVLMICLFYLFTI